MALRSGNKVSAEFSMSSMTDLVFLLLIFFIIVSTLVTPFAVKMDVPSNKQSSTVSESIKVNVHINVENQLLLNNKAVAFENLESEIQQLLGPETEGLNRNIIFTVDDDVPAGETVKVIVLARHNGWNIAVSGKKE